MKSAVRLATFPEYRGLAQLKQFVAGAEAYFGDHFGFQWDEAFLEREKPDVVIDEMLERFVTTEDPRELLAKDNLH